MKKTNKIFITKASGESVPFSADKLKLSLERAGANEDEIDRIIEEISSKLYEGISTKKIYRIAFNLLKESSRHLAAKYHLKQIQTRRRILQTPIKAEPISHTAAGSGTGDCVPNI